MKISHLHKILPICRHMTLEDALAAGKDHLSQTELVVQAVQRARPDMTVSDALTAVNLVRRE